MVHRLERVSSGDGFSDVMAMYGAVLAINKSIGISLHCIQMNREKRSITVYGQLAARIESNGFLKYYKHGDVEGQVQNLMDKWLKKNL